MWTELSSAAPRWKNALLPTSLRTVFDGVTAMLNFLTDFVLTPLLVLNCLFLMLLVLIQLPKKEAGAGIAFGGGATDALFGAGSGTALTKITKYAAGGFLALSLVLSVLRAQQAGESGRRLEEELRKKSGAQPVASTSRPPTN